MVFLLKSSTGKISAKLLLFIIIIIALIGGIYYYKSITESSRLPVTSPTPSFNPLVLTVGIDSRPTGMLFYAINHILKGKLQLKPVFIENPEERWMRMAAGDLDLAFATLPEFVLGASRHNPGALICFTSVSRGSDGILAKSEIENIEDLVGKRICAVPGSAGHYLLVKALDNQAKSTAEIKFIPASRSGDVLSYLTSGDFLDGAAISQPYLEKGKKAGKHLLISTSLQSGDDASRMNPFPIVEVLCAGRFPLKHRQKDLQVTVASYFQLVDFIEKNPGLAKKLISTRSGKSVTDVEMLFSSVKLKNLEEARAPSRESVIGEMKKIQQIWAIEALPNADRNIDFDYAVNYTFMEKAVVSPSEPIFGETPTPVEESPSPLPGETEVIIPGVPEATDTP